MIALKKSELRKKLVELREREAYRDACQVFKELYKVAMKECRVYTTLDLPTKTVIEDVPAAFRYLDKLESLLLEYIRAKQMQSPENWEIDRKRKRLGLLTETRALDHLEATRRAVRKWHD